MRHNSIRNLMMVAVLVLGMASVGHAQGNERHGQNQQNGQNGNGNGNGNGNANGQNGNGNGQNGNGNGNGARAVPEIDPTATIAALAMLTAGVFIIRARRH